jgi:PAS domain S-box-containing protein
MLTRIFSLPTFDNEELARSAKQLRTVILTMLGVTTLYIVVWFVLMPEFSYRIVFALPFYPLSIGLLYLVQRGNVKLVGSLMVAGVWLILFFAALFNGGVFAPGYSGLMITVLAAGIFMGRGWANATAMISVVAGGALVFFERQGLTSATNEFADPTTMWIAQAVFFFIAASLLQMGTQRITDALQIARREIEGRRKTEVQLRDAEKQYRELVERVPVVIYSAEPGPAGRWFYVSPRIELLSGFTPEEWLADPNLWYSLLDPKDRDKFNKGENLALAEGRQFQMEYQLRRRDGSTVWVRDESLNVTAGDLGDTKIVQGYLLDITEQKHMQETLRETELLYRTLVEQTSVVIYRDTAEEGGPSIYISPQIENMIGYSPAEFSTQPDFWQSLLHPDDKEMVFNVIDQIIKTGKSITCEYRLKSKSGGWVWLRDEAALVKDKNGKPLYIQGVYMDITKQKLMEDQRESLIKELEAKNTELERFTYTVSHDLKAPLITMGGFLGFLEQDALSGNIERLKSDVQRISGANSKMQQLLNELLELSRIGRLINPPEDIPFEQIVRESLSRVESQLKQRQVEVRVGSGLPVIRGDRVRLVEVVQNLLENAAKFIEDQSDPEIEIGSTTDGGDQIFFVRDNGIGIDPKYHAKIFELFNKLNPKAEGTGIGLALVKRIIEVHGGKIWVESDSGKGATFYFTLPSSRPLA